jgi:histidine triad (HIT) family protein
MVNCIFCQIIAGTIPGEKVFENEHVVALRDINPQAPAHLLVVPRRHIATLNDLQPQDGELMGEMMLVATQLAGQQNLAERGYRLVINCNRDGGQSIYHIHLHLLGGRYMRWPPG